ncbi:MAG TPA: Sec-independent protein translocase protein TatB [Xanthomonadales bacterium]|nr:Sec-independent protein translocase protein TatB [Xanthomonadales bacterium]
MFDVSFVELMIIGVVALIVLGPEKLPGAARTVGGLLRRARASWQSVRAEIERELAAEEMKRNMASMKASVDAATAPFAEPAEGYATPAAKAPEAADAPPATDAPAPAERRDD